MSERPVHLGEKCQREVARRRRRRQGGGGGGAGEWRERRRRRDDSFVGSTSAVDVNVRPRFISPVSGSQGVSFQVEGSGLWELWT